MAFAGAGSEVPLTSIASFVGTGKGTTAGIMGRTASGAEGSIFKLLGASDPQPSSCLLGYVERTC